MEAAVQHCNLNSTKYSRLLAEAPNIEMLRHKICTNEKAEAPEREAVQKHGERERPLDSRMSESNFLNPNSRKNKKKTIHQLCSFLLMEKVLPVEFQFNVF